MNTNHYQRFVQTEYKKMQKFPDKHLSPSQRQHDLEMNSMSPKLAWERETQYSPLGAICYLVFPFYLSNTAFIVLFFFSPRKAIICNQATMITEIITCVYMLIRSS